MRTASLVLMISLYSIGAMADGMAFRMVGADVEVRATEQRAVMWLRDSTWEIHIQPVFERGPERSAWVVPFPVQPEVHEGNIDFFEQLELLTSPVFIRMCTESGRGGTGCLLFGSDKAGDITWPEGTAYVRVWERGTLGALDYVVISSQEGSSLVDWLDAEGYEVPPAARQAIEVFETDGIFFFAARLSGEADPETPLNPVRFVLPGMDPPAYPLRLTRLVVPEGESLELTVWVISPDGQHAPESHFFQRFDSNPQDREQYDDHLEVMYARHLPEANLVLLYQEMMYLDERYYREVCSQITDCMSFDELGIEAPAAWCGEIEDIASSRSWISRYQAKLNAEHMTDDLTLSPTGPTPDRILNVFEHWDTCSEEMAAAGCLVLLALGLLLRRRS